MIGPNTSLSSIPRPAALQRAYEAALEPLSPLEQRFVHHYIEDPTNARAAAIKAGYAPSGAGPIAYKFLGRADVLAAIDAGRLHYARALRFDLLAWLKENHVCAYSDVTALHFDSDGKPVKEQGNEQAWRAVRKITHRKSVLTDGTVKHEHVVEMHPKGEHLRLLGQFAGLFSGELRDEEAPPPVLDVPGIDARAILGE